jgi:radical SAM protein with 4Fe4S-binding SPASM domain
LAGTGICFVSHRGEVYPCGYLPVSAGNVRTQSFASIWEEAHVFEELRDPNLLLGKCGVCEYRIVCGGCRARAFGQTGIYLYEEPFCNYLPSTANSE